MTLRALLTGVTSLVVLAAFVIADEPQQGKTEISLENIKCVMNPKGGAKAETGVAYKEGKVFFCCNNCAGKFDAEKNAVAANRQLVATKQYTQVACPLSGGKCNAEQKVKVDGCEICFCCPNCKGKVEKAEGAAQAELLFSEKAFAKAFKPTKQDEKKETL